MTMSLYDNHAVGRALRRWRTLNRVKQSALAEDLGVSQSTVSRWENLLLEPEPWEARRLVARLAARPDASSDRALIDLVRGAPTAMHLICDLTHRLLAVSSGRLERWRVGADELIGTSLWRFASNGIMAGEAGLAARGWYEPVAGDVVVETECVAFPELTIMPGKMRYTRMPLADGGFARLVRAEDGDA
jgi:DNA-binding XRE family transcriptional regulator